MFDVWLGIGDINFTSLIIIVSIAVVLPLQILLCFKGKSVWVRLAPVIVFALAVVALLLYGFLWSDGWEGIGFLFFAIYAGDLLFVCGVGWLVWSVTMLVRKLRKK